MFKVELLHSNEVTNFDEGKQAFTFETLEEAEAFVARDRDEVSADMSPLDIEANGVGARIVEVLTKPVKVVQYK